MLSGSKNGTLCPLCSHLTAISKLCSCDNVIPASFALDLSTLTRTSYEDNPSDRKEVYDMVSSAEKLKLLYRSAIDDLEAEYTQLQSYISYQKARIAPLKQLPVEILIHIFGALGPNVLERRSRRGSKVKIDLGGCATLILSQVCSSWRSLVHQTPSLWSNISVSNYNYAPSFCYLANMLQVYLTRSQNHALDLIFLHANVWEVTKPHIGRIRSIVCDLYPFLATGPEVSFPNLKTLHIQSCSSVYPSIFPPSLADLSIPGPQYLSSHITKVGSLKELSVYYCSPGVLANGNFGSLEYLFIHQDSDETEQACVLLPSLKTLNLSLGNKARNSNLDAMFITPSLQSLSITRAIYAPDALQGLDHEDPNRLLPCLQQSRISRSLESLQLKGLTVSPSCLERIFSIHPNIKTLQLEVNWTVVVDTGTNIDPRSRMYSHRDLDRLHIEKLPQLTSLKVNLADDPLLNRLPAGNDFSTHQSLENAKNSIKFLTRCFQIKTLKSLYFTYPALSFEGSTVTELQEIYRQLRKVNQMSISIFAGGGWIRLGKGN